MKRLPLLLLLALGAPTAALAAEESPHTFTANVGLYSQYVFRGLQQTDGDPALQGGFDYAHSSGFYAGLWGSNINWLRDGGFYTDGGSLELDLYGGYRGSVGDFGYDLGVLRYQYPGQAPAGRPKAHTTELYAAVSWKWISLKYSHSLGDTFAVDDAAGTSYLDLSASVPIGETGLTAGLHYGMQRYDGSDAANAGGASNDALYSYDDWKVSLAYDMGKLGGKLSGVTVGVAYTDTDAKRAGYTLAGDYIGDGQTTVWVSRTF